MAYTLAYVLDPDIVEDGITTPVHTTKIHEINLLTKRIFLKLGTIAYHPVDDIYKEMRFHRANDESLRVLDLMVDAAGNIPKGGGKFTSRLAIFNDGWKVVPANENHTLKVTGEQISDAGESGVAIMDLTLSDDGVNVAMEYAPPDTEIVVINTGSGVTEQDKLDIANRVWIEAVRTLTEQSGLTSEESAKLLSVPTAVENKDVLLATTSFP